MAEQRTVGVRNALLGLGKLSRATAERVSPIQGIKGANPGRPGGSTTNRYSGKAIDNSQRPTLS